MALAFFDLVALADFEAGSGKLGEEGDAGRDGFGLVLFDLVDAGVQVDGAFYIYADVTRLGNDSEALCRRLLAETGVAMTPGTDFDTRRGNAFVRISFAGTTEDMLAAAKRLVAWRQSRAT